MSRANTIHNMKNSSIKFVLALVALIMLIAYPCQAAVLYDVQGIGNLPGLEADNAAPAAINENGVYVVQSFHGGTIRSSYGKDGGPLTEIRYPEKVDTVWVSDINESGQVVGEIGLVYGPNVPDGNSSAFVWDKHSGFTDLGDLPGGDDFSYAIGINDHGQVVGSSLTGMEEKFGVGSAFIWDATEGMRQIPDSPTGYHPHSADDINDQGVVAGVAETPDGTQRAYIWGPDNGFLDLGTLRGGEGFSVAYALNDNGQVVGMSSAVGAEDASHAFLWDPVLGLIDIGDFAGGLVLSNASDVNDKGQVVGYGRAADGSQAFLWTRDQGLMDLNDFIDPHSEWSLTGATAINNAGLIVGYGKNPAGDYEGFILTPRTTSVPLPASAWLLLVGLCAISVPGIWASMRQGSRSGAGGSARSPYYPTPPRQR